MKKISNTAKRLNYILNYKGMKQADLVRKTNLPKSAISQYLSGKVEPKQDNLYIIAEALNVSEAWLMGYDTDMEKIISSNIINLSNQEKALIDKFRQLNEQQKYKVMGYIDSELNNIAKESTPIYKIENTHLKAAEDEIPYNKDSKDTVKVPLVANTGENGYVDIDRGFLEELGRRHMEEREQELEYNRKTRELLKRFHLEDDED